MANDKGHGTTITWASGFVTSDIENIDWSGISRGTIETTTMSTSGGQTFVGEANYNPGELSVTFLFDNTSTPPITATEQNCTIDFAGLGQTFAAQAILTNADISMPDKDMMRCTATLKFSGSITF